MTRALMVAAALALLVLGLREIVPEGSGLGWDGKIYAEMIRAFPALDVSAYYVGRTLPTELIALALQPFGTATENIVNAFRLWNAVMVVASVLAWARIARLLKVDSWLGFAAMFLTFLVAKQTPYDPVLVDPTALLIGLLLLLFSVEERRWALALTGFVGSFCWPTAGLTAACLLVFKGGKEVRFRHELLIAGALAGLALFLVPNHYVRSFATGIPSFFLVAGAAAMLGFPYLRREGRALAATALFLPFIVKWALSNGTSHGMDLRTFIGFAVFPDQVGKFYLPVLALAAYFGPFFILAAANWRAVSTVARERGWAMPIMVHLPLALVSEPRYWILLWPFVGTSVLLAVKVPKWPAIGLSLLYSRFWLPINTVTWPQGETVGLYEWPKQLWFGNFGFWMGWPAYLGWIAVLCATNLFLRWEARSQAERASA